MRTVICPCQDTIKYIVCGQLVSENAFLHQRRQFSEHVLIIVTEGTLFINSNGCDYKVTRGQFILLRADELHYGTLESRGHLAYFWVHFNADLAICDRHQDNASCISFPEYGDYSVNGRLSLLFHQLSDISFSDDAWSREMCDHAIIMLLLELSRECKVVSTDTNPLPVAVSGAIEWINKNYYAPFSVQDLAQKYGYTTDYFSFLFKKSTGTPLVKYINSVRIRASKALLSGLGVSIKEVAYSCGFPDEKYYMRVFKASEGITPSQYRNMSSKAYINEQ